MSSSLLKLHKVVSHISVYGWLAPRAGRGISEGGAQLMGDALRESYDIIGQEEQG